MRQRGLKTRDSIMEDCASYMVQDPKGFKGQWGNLFDSKKPLYVEIGSGKGQFICGLAANHSDSHFLACEGGFNIYPRILQKAKSMELNNFFSICEYIVEPNDYFEKGELAGVFLNFSDPWPKDRYAHRRLTHVKKLLEYKEIMEPGTTLQFKTDNDDLFAFSLEQVKLAGLKLEFYSDDIHQYLTEHPECLEEKVNPADIYSFEQTTEYEDKFSALGKAIHYLRIRF